MSLKPGIGVGNFPTETDLLTEQVPVPTSPPADPMAWRNHEVTTVKELLRDIDVQIQKVKELPPSRERSLSITKLQEAVMWLGMDFKRLNEPNPYPNSKDPSNTKIDPTADGLKL